VRKWFVFSIIVETKPIFVHFVHGFLFVLGDGSEMSEIGELRSPGLARVFCTERSQFLCIFVHVFVFCDAPK